MKVVVRIPFSPEGLKPFLEQLPRGLDLGGIETSAGVLDDDTGWEDALDAFDTPLVSMHNLLPVNVSRYLAEAGELARKALLQHMRFLLEKAAACGVEFASIDLGVERRGDSDLEEMLTAKAAMLRDLIPDLERLGLVLCVSDRFPGATPGQPRSNASLLVSRVSHPAVRLAINVYPAELPPDTDPDPVLKTYGEQLAVLRWHYEPLLGDRLRTRFREAWQQALRYHGYAGILVACPQIADPFTYGHEIARFGQPPAGH